jgi:hypothetical protein
MLDKWALILNLAAFVLLAVLLVFQFQETTAYVDAVGNLFK